MRATESGLCSKHNLEGHCFSKSKKKKVITFIDDKTNKYMVCNTFSGGA